MAEDNSKELNGLIIQLKSYTAEEVIVKFNILTTHTVFDIF